MPRRRYRAHFGEWALVRLPTGSVPGSLEDPGLLGRPVGRSDHSTGCVRFGLLAGQEASLQGRGRSGKGFDAIGTGVGYGRAWPCPPSSMPGPDSGQSSLEEGGQADGRYGVICTHHMCRGGARSCRQEQYQGRHARAPLLAESCHTAGRGNSSEYRWFTFELSGFHSFI